MYKLKTKAKARGGGKMISMIITCMPLIYKILDKRTKRKIKKLKKKIIKNIFRNLC